MSVTACDVKVSALEFAVNAKSVAAMTKEKVTFCIPAAIAFPGVSIPDEMTFNAYVPSGPVIYRGIETPELSELFIAATMVLNVVLSISGNLIEIGNPLFDWYCL